MQHYTSSDCIPGRSRRAFFHSRGSERGYTQLLQERNVVLGTSAHAPLRRRTARGASFPQPVADQIGSRGFMSLRLGIRGTGSLTAMRSIRRSSNFKPYTARRSAGGPPGRRGILTRACDPHRGTVPAATMSIALRRLPRHRTPLSLLPSAWLVRFSRAAGMLGLAGSPSTLFWRGSAGRRMTLRRRLWPVSGRSPSDTKVSRSSRANVSADVVASRHASVGAAGGLRIPGIRARRVIVHAEPRTLRRIVVCGPWIAGGPCDRAGRPGPRRSCAQRVQSWKVGFRRRVFFCGEAQGSQWNAATAGERGRRRYTECQSGENSSNLGHSRFWVDSVRKRAPGCTGARHARHHGKSNCTVTRLNGPLSSSFVTLTSEDLGGRPGVTTMDSPVKGMTTRSYDAY